MFKSISKKVLKYVVAGVLVGGAGGVVDSIKDGHTDPASMAGSAVAGIVAYWMRGRKSGESF